MGRNSELQLLLNLQHPQELSRLLHYHSDIMQFRREQIVSYQINLDKLVEVEKKIKNSVARLQAKQVSMQTEHAHLVQKRKDREQTLARIRSLLKNKDEELQQQKKQQQELEQIIAAASRIAKEIGFEKGHTPFKQRKGKLPWPIHGSIQYGFGAKRNGSLQWNGVLIKAAAGTPVKAIHSGRVLFADWLPGQGLLMIIDHGDSYMSLYGHNDVLLKEPGEWVNGGDTIARSGNSGGQQIAGLYFEIRYRGSPTNPSNWCKRG